MILLKGEVNQMNTIKFISRLFVLAIILACIPQQLFGQRIYLDKDKCCSYYGEEITDQGIGHIRVSGKRPILLASSQ